MSEEDYEIVLGLEVHIELATATKIFCGCSTKFGGTPNSHTCPVCTGMPGSLPVLNKKVLEYAIAMGLATDCEITRYGRFDRKNYFYPDNPQNYQISQLYLPICRNGSVEIKTKAGDKRVRIHEMHMEEDAGKLIHDDVNDITLVDYNRSGVPLIEIVSEPDMRNAEEVIAYLEKIRTTAQYLGVSDCKLQEGSMRADVNLSVHKHGEALGTRAEMKNLSSFKAITRAIEYESGRQEDLIESGEQVVQETRRWDDNKGCSYPMRSKEDAKDYRYFPDPDIPPVRVTDDMIDEIRGHQPEFREEKEERYAKEYDLPEYDIEQLTSSKHLADLFEAAAAICGKPKLVSNWLMSETMRLMKETETDPEDLRFSPEHLAALVELTSAKKINSSVAKTVFEKIFSDDIDPEVYVKENGLETVEDDGAIKTAAEKIISDNPQSVADYEAGKKKAIGFLVGQMMKETHGKVDPASVSQILEELLNR
ncbi:MAG: Asp-tRNA(Asn)/Glu-tRNA(Gln) amidotransferase subunit GatB [Lachnospiraceae bacterium]|jgi:aspartyl-tRNA(Asn)/glutamyl-tRNA(Gln) amidotransferase subunit B|nr:Asp-tRNA(Asn)/Glu-tRNA(Gln) amidotransferase subunit GatB [Lachnospiraceae bacterium]